MPTSDPLKRYVGYVWIGDKPGERLSIMASSPDEAVKLVEAEHGEGHVISIKNEDDAKRPREPDYGNRQAPVADRSDQRVELLLNELDEPLEGRADEATAELIAAGEVVLEPLLGRVKTLGRLGQLCAIEIFEALGADQAIPALTEMLASEDASIREWAARTLGGLGAQEAVPHLWELLRQSGNLGTPPDWTEPVAIRHALTELGARNAVIPKEFAPRIINDENLGLAVPDDSLEDSLMALKDAGQVVLYFQRWRPWKDTWTRIDGETWELDWNSPWTTLLAASNQLATQAARGRTPDASAVVTIEWMAADDWPRSQMTESSTDFEYVVWFQDPLMSPDDQDFEWPAVFVVAADSATSAQKWGDTLALDYAGRTNQVFLWSRIDAEPTLDARLPRVADGEQATDAHIGW